MMEVAIVSCGAGLLLGWCLAVMMGETRKSVTHIAPQITTRINGDDLVRIVRGVAALIGEWQFVPGARETFADMLKREGVEKL
jgi:hypothetical protein